MFTKHERQLSTQTHRESWAMRLFLWLIPLWEHCPKLSYFKEKVRKLWHATDIWVFSWPSYMNCILVYWINRYASKNLKSKAHMDTFKKSLFSLSPPLIEHLFHMGEGCQVLGSRPEELSAAACLLGRRIEAFSTGLVHPVIMDLH